jgi:DNA-binding transcriptional MerR regulator
MKKVEWTLQELGEEAGVPARTIRYYIARGLLEGPEVAGRGAMYGARHLERLLAIRKQQREGRMLAEIAQAPGAAELPRAESWWQYPLADGVVVQVRADLAPWRLKLIRKAIAEIAAKFKEEPTDV